LGPDLDGSDPPRWNGDDQAAVARGPLDAGMRAATRAYVVNGSLVAFFDALDLIFEGEDGRFPFPLLGAWLVVERFETAGPHAVTLAARIREEDVPPMGPPLGICPGTGDFERVQQLANGALDLWDEDGDSPETLCNRVSVGMTMEAVAVTIVGERPRTLTDHVCPD